MPFIAGPYTATYNNLDLGITEDGFDIDQTAFQESIRGDNNGDSHQDHVYRGANVFASWTAQEWDAAGMSIAYWPWSTLGAMGQVGRLATNVASSLVLSVVAGTTAVAAGPAAFTAAKSILAADFDVKHILSTRHRKMPLRHQLYPHYSGGTIWFTVGG